MASKKIIVITYYWPPAGGPGVQRWLKFVKYLPKFDIEPIVFCPENPNYPIIDNSLESEIPEGLTVLKFPIKEPYGLAKQFSSKETKVISSGVIPEEGKQSLLQKLMLFVRGNFFIPDARKNWVRPSIRFLSKYIDSNNIDTVITTGPPHSLHLIGMGLKEKLDITWLADFRDPWTTIGYHKALKLTGRSKAKHLKLEADVLNKADKIIVTSNHTKREFEEKTRTPVTLITNGYDTHSISIEKKEDLFTLSHIGSLLSQRNPKILWEVLSEMVNNNQEFSKLFRLKLAGVISPEVLESIKAHNLYDHVELLGYLDHKSAIALQMSSQVLLLIEIDSEDTKAIIPGKLFEYIISDTPILAIGPQGSDIEAILSSTNTGNYFTYQDKEKLESHLQTLFEAYKNGTLEVNAIGLKPYSRKELTRQLAALLK